MSVLALMYDAEGVIRRQIQVRDGASVSLNTGVGETALIVDSISEPELYWVNAGVLTLRTPFPTVVAPLSVTMGTDIVVTGIPSGSTVIWPDGEVTVETDGEVSCDTPYVGEYVFKFGHLHHLASEVTINVTA
jgi:hypothetical protein